GGASVSIGYTLMFPRFHTPERIHPRIGHQDRRAQTSPHAQSTAGTPGCESCATSRAPAGRDRTCASPQFLQGHAHSPVTTVLRRRWRWSELVKTKIGLPYESLNFCFPL